MPSDTPIVIYDDEMNFLQVQRLMNVVFPSISGENKASLKKLVNRVHDPTAEDGFSYMVTSADKLQKIYRLAATTPWSKNTEKNPYLEYMTLSKRPVKLPVNIFGDKESISGPVSLHRVVNDGRVYMFFGDVHDSVVGECRNPKTSVSIENLIKKLVANDTNEMPSIDFFAETSYLKELPYLHPQKRKEPIWRWNGFKGMDQCFIAEDRYKKEFTEQCGLNFRYHCSDIREVSDREFSPSQILDVDEIIVDAIDIIILEKKLFSLIENKLSSEYVHEVVKVDMRPKLLKTIKGDSNFAAKLQKIFLKIVGLDSSFLTAFSEGTVARLPHGSSKLDRLILKQIRQTRPETVADIFNFVFQDFLMSLYKHNGLEMQREEEWNQLLVSPMSMKEKYFKKRLTWSEASVIAKNSTDLKQALEELEKDATMSDDDKLEAMKRFSVMSQMNSSSLLFLDENVSIMDLYTLLRIERKYPNTDKPRVLYDASGRVIDADEYVKHRPIRVEVVICYTGVYHADVYARYFASRGGRIESFYPKSSQDITPSVSSDLVTLRDHQERILDKCERSRDRRCIHIGRPIPTLLVPDVPYDQVEVIPER